LTAQLTRHKYDGNSLLIQLYFFILKYSFSSTLSASLKKSFGEPELLSAAEGNGWRPAKGAEKVDAHKGSSLIAKGLPPILQCHLKRFDYDWGTDTMTKLNNRLCFPDVLDLSDLCGTKDEDDLSLTTYELQSVVIHTGEYGAGHYCELGLYGKPLR
jgi:ubiquitin C-terminal hydrolase